MLLVLPVTSGAKGGGFKVDATLPVLSVPLGAEGGGFRPGSGGAGFGSTGVALGLEGFVVGFFSAAAGSSLPSVQGHLEDWAGPEG